MIPSSFEKSIMSPLKSPFSSCNPREKKKKKKSSDCPSDASSLRAAFLREDKNGEILRDETMRFARRAECLMCEKSILLLSEREKFLIISTM
jgi:hypothetical protein